MADFNQFRVARDADGNPEPIVVESPRFEFEVEMVPLTVGDTYNLEGWGDTSQRDWPLVDKIYMLKNNVMAVDGEDIEIPDDVEDAKDYIANGFKPYAIDDVVVAVIFNSGLDEMFEDEDKGKAQALASMM